MFTWRDATARSAPTAGHRRDSPGWYGRRHGRALRDQHRAARARRPPGGGQGLPAGVRDAVRPLRPAGVRPRIRDGAQPAARPAHPLLQGVAERRARGLGVHLALGQPGRLRPAHGRPGCLGPRDRIATARRVPGRRRRVGRDEHRAVHPPGEPQAPPPLPQARILARLAHRAHREARGPACLAARDARRAGRACSRDGDRGMSRSRELGARRPRSHGRDRVPWPSRAGGCGHRPGRRSNCRVRALSCRGRVRGGRRDRAT